MPGQLQQQIDEMESRRKRLLEAYSKACIEKRDNPLLPEHHTREALEEVKHVENQIKTLCRERDQLAEEHRKSVDAGQIGQATPVRGDDTNPLIVENDDQNDNTNEEE